MLEGVLHNLGQGHQVNKEVCRIRGMSVNVKSEVVDNAVSLSNTVIVISALVAETLIPSLPLAVG